MNLEIAKAKLKDPKLTRWFYIALYLLAAFHLSAKFLTAYDPKHGYTWFPHMGSNSVEARSDKLQKLPYHILNNSYGYDGQYYAELSLHPTIQDPQLLKSQDNFNYRARRILFSWTAYAFGLGDDSRVLNAYSIQNVFFWLLFAVLLLHWFPPNHWQNAIRYISCLYTVGLVQSLNYALLDGPSLFIVALGVYLIEKNKNTLGAIALAISGLGKETNLLAAAAIRLPDQFDFKHLLRYALRGVLIAAPLFIWIGYVYSISSGPSNHDAGLRNFNLPFVGWLNEVGKVIKSAGEGHFHTNEKLRLVLLFSLFIQALYFIARPKIKSAWWRIGTSYTVLMLCLGEAVWEGAIGAAPRVLLPMTIAFNILFSRKTSLVPLLLFVNAISWIGYKDAHTPTVRTIAVNGPNELTFLIQEERYSILDFDENWYGVKQNIERIWNWSNGDSQIAYINPHARPLKGVFVFSYKTLSPRAAKVEHNGKIVFTEQIQPIYTDTYRFEVIVPPGENVFRFFSPDPTDRAPNDPRDLGFALVDFSFEIAETEPQ